MLCWISMVGGLLIMMGHQSRSEALFYYFRLEDQVPESHLLRLIDKHAIYRQLRTSAVTRRLRASVHSLFEPDSK